MITLPKLLVSDADITSAPTGVNAGADAGGAQDFFALLSGAMSGKTGKDGKLTLADLQAASQTLPQDEAKATLSQLLSQQGEDESQKVDLTTLTDAQSVLSALTPEAKSDVVKQLTKDLQKAEEKPTLSEEDLAGLSALMAMLPHTAPATAVTPAASGETVTAATGSGVKGFADLATAVSTAGTSHSTGKEFAVAPTGHGVQAVHTDDASSQATPLLASLAAKADTDSTLSAAAPVATAAPVISNATATVNTHPVVTVNSQLGTPEWQQNVSQHITLFTRQGQQTAELKLHPENLGQVNITLKIDDNQAQIQMISPHSHVRAALEAAIPTLRTQLADNGIQLAQSNVSSESFAGQQQQQPAFGQPSSQRSAEGRANPSDNEETLSVPVSLQAEVRGNGMVDTFA